MDEPRKRSFREIALHNPTWELLACGAALEVGFAIFLIMSLAKDWTLLPILFFILFALYLISIVYVRKRLPATMLGVSIVIAYAVAFRLTLLFSGPIFSFDMYRYIWDGKVAANGINPFIYTPDAPALAHLRDSNWEFINHKYLRTGYPPLTELLFEFLYVAFRSIVSYKITFFVFDLGTISVLLLILKELKLDVRNLIVYAWAPLPIVEIVQSGHNDSVAVFFVFLSFFMMARRKNFMSAIIMALAVVSKIYPAFFAPILFKRWGKWGTMSFLVLTVASHIPYVEIGPRIYVGLLYAINTSNFNGSIFPLITSMADWMKLTSNPGLVTQFIVYAIYGTLFTWTFIRSLREQLNTTQLMEISFCLTGAVLLLNRSFFSWYMTWIIPFITFYMFKSWLLLSGTTFLGYMKYDSFPAPDHESVSPQMSTFIDIVEYLPFYVILIYEIIKKTHSMNRLMLHWLFHRC